MEIGGETYRIVHPTVADALISEEDFERDERLPYWADLWPSAIALSCYLARRDLVGKRAIELGCGVGLPSVTALDGGARVTATDYYEAPLDFTAYNARTNTGREPDARLFDWRDPPESLPRFDLVLGADVLYEARDCLALADLVPKLLAEDGEAIFADPGRNTADVFVEEMKEQGFLVSTEETGVEQDGREVKVKVHRLKI